MSYTENSNPELLPPLAVRVTEPVAVSKHCCPITLCSISIASKQQVKTYYIIFKQNYYTR